MLYNLIVSGTLIIDQLELLKIWTVVAIYFLFMQVGGWVDGLNGNKANFVLFQPSFSLAILKILFQKACVLGSG